MSIPPNELPDGTYYETCDGGDGVIKIELPGRMKIPKEIQVGAHTYRVSFRKNLAMVEKYRGTADHFNQEIIIEETEEGTRLASTFWHEVLHCIDKIYTNLQVSEDVTNSLSEGLTQVLEGMGITFER